MTPKRAALRMVAIVAGAMMATPALAASCITSKGQFGAYKQQLAQQAAASGVKKRGLQALQQAKLSGITWRFESNPASQSSMRYRSPEQFLKSRFSSVNTFVSGAKRKLQQNARLFKSIEQRYGVPGSILVAIWGYETNWGGYTGNTPIVSGAVTLASYCRRHPRFEDDAIAALQLVDRGLITATAAAGRQVNSGTCSFWRATGCVLPSTEIATAVQIPTMQPTRLQRQQTCFAAMGGGPDGLLRTGLPISGFSQPGTTAATINAPSPMRLA